MVHYDSHGYCETCGLPGTGFEADGVCDCLEDEILGSPNSDPYSAEEIDHDHSAW
jgi:hypothetical protein